MRTYKLHTSTLISALIFIIAGTFMLAAIALVPKMELDIILILMPATMIPVWIIAHRSQNNQFFTILTFWSLIFLSECFGGAISACLPNSQYYISTDYFINSIVVYFIGYLVFLAGYFWSSQWFFKKKHGNLYGMQSVTLQYPYQLSKNSWNALFLILTITISLTVVQPLQRIKAAGGVTQYLFGMYQYRFGTLTEDVVENSFVVISNLVGGLSLTLAGIGLLMCLTYRVEKYKRNLIFSFLAFIMFMALTSGFRSTAFFSLLSLVGLYSSVRRLSFSKLLKYGSFLLGALIAINSIHQYMYYVTADWDYQNFQDTLIRLLAPQGHLSTLSSVLSTADNSQLLQGKSILESFFFFVPRFIWESKSDIYGTKIVQLWAGLPDWYQSAPTAVGELVAHFGYVGIIGMIIIGFIHGWLETLRLGNSTWQAVYYCLVLPRLLVHAGMGISALTLTIFQLGLLYVLTKLLFYTQKTPRRDPCSK